jgi:ABC-type antimicrobial peptide transport system permease subunit
MLGEDRARGLLTIAAATVALVMVAVGFYGTQQFLVAAGRREYAIRASLGAGPKSLGRLVIRRGLALGIPGFVFGVPLVFIVVSWLRDEFLSREISSLSVALITVVGLMPILLIASLGPARAAKATQPAALLRQE